MAGVLLALSAPLAGCSAGSTFDDYSEGVPDVVPSPVEAEDGEDAGRRDAGSNRDAGTNHDGGGSKQAVGGACDDEGDCADDDATCQTKVDVIITSYNLKGGYCTVACQSDQQCPSGSGCGLFGSCLKKCTANNQCRTSEGYTCSAAGGTQSFCLPSDLANDISSLGGLAGGLLGGGGTGAAGGTGGFIGGLFGGTTGGATGGFIAGFLGGAGGGAAGPGGTGN